MPDTSQPSEWGSVTIWLDLARQGDEKAAAQLWERYLHPVLREARRSYHFPNGATGADDISQSVFFRVFDGARNGKFDFVTDRERLWAVLLKIVHGKIVDLIRRDQSRGGRLVQPLGETDIEGSDPVPQILAILREQHQRLQDSLRDDVSREIARLRMESYKRQEIADELGIALSTVDRKLKLIRCTWDRMLNDDET